MSEKNNINNMELNNCWKLLHDIEETVSNTTFRIGSDEVDRVRELIRETDKRCSDDSIPIKVVVTGRMKAGKSMMTDVLFLEGKGTLHSQATPATANITYIRYKDGQDKQDAKVSFLKRADVEEMENYLSKQNEDGGSDAVADKVRYRETKKKLENINANPEKRDKWLGHADKWVSLADLKEYSDVGGEFSDYVSQIEIYVREDELRNLEIVDTPGLGDPVASRSQKAREESRKAEVVFFLSRAGHFMDMEDADEFVRLKRAGCKNIVVVMSQFDEVLETEEEDELFDLKETMIYDQLADGGKERIKSAMKQAGIEYEPVEIIPICALAEKLSRHTLEEGDEFYRSKMKQVFRNLSDYDAVHELSGMARLWQEIERVNREKKQIREEFNRMKLQECQNTVSRIYQELKEKIENEIAIKQYVIDHPDNMGKVVRALDDWNVTLTVDLEKEMGEINSMIDVECQSIKKEISRIANSAKTGISDAQSPSSINDAYEVTFKNPINDMFEMGIEARLSLDSHSGTHGKMFQHFGDSLAAGNVPEEIKHIGMENKLYGILQNGFEARINKDYSDKLKAALPIGNVLTVLNDQYRIVRQNSPDFNSKRWTRTGETRNAESKARCKEAIDDALSSLHQSLDVLTYSIELDPLEKIETDLKAEIANQIESYKTDLRTSTEQTLKAEIEKYEKLLENLENMSEDKHNG